MVDIVASEDALILDFQSVTSTGPGGKVTGLEAVMQVRMAFGLHMFREIIDLIALYVGCSYYTYRL
jgi:hypothetical protein